MTRVRAAIRGAMDKVFPWPARRDRKAAIEAARGDRAQAEARAAHAEGVRAQIEQMAATNHFAAAIADQIITRHGGKA